MTNQVFRNTFTVQPSAIDALNHVNNIAYLQWCLDTAEKHWISKTDNIIQKQFVWVVLNHFISYKAPAFLNEEIEVQTWVESYEGVKCTRKYNIIRLSDDKTLVEAETLWCFIDAETFRPTKITEDIGNLF